MCIETDDGRHEPPRQRTLPFNNDVIARLLVRAALERYPQGIEIEVPVRPDVARRQLAFFDNLSRGARQREIFDLGIDDPALESGRNLMWNQRELFPEELARAIDAAWKIARTRLIAIIADQA